MKNKDKCQQDHFRRRLLERFGVKLTQFIWDNILYKIHDNKAKLVKRQSNRVSIWDVEIEADGSLMIRVVYDRQRKNLVSALTLDMDCEVDID